MLWRWCVATDAMRDPSAPDVRGCVAPRIGWLFRHALCLALDENGVAKEGGEQIFISSVAQVRLAAFMRLTPFSSCSPSMVFGAVLREKITRTALAPTVLCHSYEKLIAVALYQMSRCMAMEVSIW
jgi:hypothetical protein